MVLTLDLRNKTFISIAIRLICSRGRLASNAYIELSVAFARAIIRRAMSIRAGNNLTEKILLLVDL